MLRLLIERQPRAALLAERPEAAKMIDYPASDDYMRQVAAQNLPGSWSRLDLPVLVIYGSADFVTSEDDNRAIVDAVNRFGRPDGPLAEPGRDRRRQLAAPALTSHRRRQAGLSGTS